MKLEFSRQFSKNTHRFHENPSSGSQVFLCGQTDRWADMAKLIVAFRNFVNAAKNSYKKGKHLPVTPSVHIPVSRFTRHSSKICSVSRGFFVTFLVSLSISWIKSIFLSYCNSRLKSGNACYHSAQHLFFLQSAIRKFKERIYRTIILPVVVYGCETLSLTLRQERRLRFGSKRDEVTGDWRKLHNE